MADSILFFIFNDEKENHPMNMIHDLASSAINDLGF